eukprot:1035181-Rhodomonas_salina.2
MAPSYCCSTRSSSRTLRRLHASSRTSSRRCALHARCTRQQFRCCEAGSVAEKWRRRGAAAEEEERRYRTAEEQRSR